jgi:drug/metabolite transporter (DMT)-like permease
MTILLLILLIGLVFESTGIILLKKGMNTICQMHGYSVSEIVRVAKAGVTSPQVILGVFFQALYFFCLLILMSASDISFLWPLTALSFVFATFAAMIFLSETVSKIRWAGVILIMIGVGFIWASN